MKTPTSHTRYKVRGFRLSDAAWQEIQRLAARHHLSCRAVVEMRFTDENQWRELFGHCPHKEVPAPIAHRQTP